MQILEELYLHSLGCSHKQSEDDRHNKQYAEYLRASAESENRLLEALNDQQKELFSAYLLDQQNLADITDCETFIRGFKTGAKLMMDVLIGGEVNKL